MEIWSLYNTCTYAQYNVFGRQYQCTVDISDMFREITKPQPASFIIVQILIDLIHCKQ